MTTEHAEFLQKLRADFVKEFSGDLRALEPMLEATRRGEKPHEEAVRAAGEFFHRLSGVAETFGLSTLGRLAAVCDRIADLARDAAPESRARIFEIMCVGAGATRESLHEIEGGELQAPTLQFPTPQQRVITRPLFESDRSASIAVVDDDETSGQIISACLESAGYQTTLIRDPRVAADDLGRALPDLVLLDVAMPELDGFALCEQLRKNPALALVPIIFVTAKNDTAQKIRGLTVGGNDYIEKPFNPDELVARVSAHLERLRTIRELAIRDGLTGVYNHKFIEALIDQEVKRSLRYDTPLSFAIMDVDHFKHINDRHGHQTGDAVLTRMVSVLSGQLRTSDAVGRWGGDEFVIVLTETPLAAAEGVIRRVVSSVRAVEFSPAPESAGNLRVTTSIGVSGLRKGDTAALLIERADKALYRAKEAGRDRAEVEA